MSDYQPFNEKMRLIRFRMKREDLRFADEIRLIPRGLVVVVIVLYAIVLAITQIVNHYTQDLAPAGYTPVEGAWMLAAAVTGAAIPIAALIFVIGYVNRDARRRGMNSGLWATLVIILLPAWLLTGFVIYFLIREPLLAA